MSTCILLLDWGTASWSYAGQGYPVTLTAEVTVVNQSEKDIVGYTHRLSVPVTGHLQQELIRIRYEYPEGLERKNHRHGDSEYVELHWDIPAKSSSTRKVQFDLLVSDYDYRKNSNNGSFTLGEEYLKPAEYIESDSEVIKRLASQIERTFETEEERLRAAYLLPQQLIDYQVQSTAGALSAVEHAKGDCTEFAALFVALARAMGYPARMTSDFLFTSKSEFRQPNHHSAEVYLNGIWIPVDPNLALDPSFGYGFGVGKSKKIIINRDFTWVWSNLWPQSFRGFSKYTNVDVRWVIH